MPAFASVRFASTGGTVFEGGGRPYGGVENAVEDVLDQLVRATMVTS